LCLATAGGLPPWWFLSLQKLLTMLATTLQSTTVVCNVRWPLLPCTHRLPLSLPTFSVVVSRRSFCWFPSLTQPMTVYLMWIVLYVAQYFCRRLNPRPPLPHLCPTLTTVHAISNLWSFCSPCCHMLYGCCMAHTTTILMLQFSFLFYLFDLPIAYKNNKKLCATKITTCVYLVSISELILL
jgi:hypothetical protein